jgi:hypothetical protein
MPREARPLFVVSNDYGELGLAMLFLHGQAVSERAALALPGHLHAAHRDILPGATHRYGSIADLLDLVDAHRANVVLLFSGYLLANGQVLSHELLAELVGSLRERGCVVVTSDPFLGLASRLTGAHIGPDVPYVPGGTSRVRPHLAEGLVRAAEVLRPTVHLYHRAPAEWLTKQAPRSVGFFNPNVPHDGTNRGERRWLFVLGSEDVALQQRLFHRELRGDPADEGGVGHFAPVVARLLEQTADVGRTPTLVGPSELLAALPPTLAARGDFRPFCPFDEFSRLVLEADCVFYWNVFSASVLPRLERRLPVFFFDRGHMARVILPLYGLGLTLHYGQWRPAYLDQNVPLDPQELQRHWATHGFGNHEALDVWSAASPSPDVLLSGLVND